MRSRSLTSRGALGLTLGLTLGLGLLAAPQSALAQTPEEIARAKSRFAEGRTHLEKGRYDEAAAAFEESYSLSGRSELLFYVAQAHEKRGDLLAAQRHYQRYLDETPSASNAEQVLDTIIQLSQRIKKEYARVKVSAKPPTGQVFVRAEAEPRCALNDEDACQIVLPPGQHTLLLKRSGQRDETLTLSVSAGQTQEVSFAPKDVNTARVMVRSDLPGASLTVGPRRATLPLQDPLALPPGTYPIQVTSPRAAWSGQITLEDDQTAQVFVPLEHAEEASGAGGPSWRRTGAYVALSAGAGLLAGGLWMGAQTRATYDALEAQRRAGRLDADLVERGRSQQTGANVLLVGATLGLLGGAGLLTWDLLDGARQPNPEPSPEPSKRPDAAPSDPEDDLL